MSIAYVGKSNRRGCRRYIGLLSHYNVWARLGLFLAALPAAMAEMHSSTTTFRQRNRRSPEARKLQLGPAGGEAGIRFEDVSFKHPGQERWAIEHIDLFIPKGQSLGLVGHNGAGKMTLIKLLTRLYEPTSGRILLDGLDLRAWDQESLRQRIGVVFQDFNRYQLTFHENVAMGSIDHAGDTSRMERAIDSGGARDVLAQLPRGLDSPLGRWFQGGAELSGGQWQKIALARAYLREDADILVLDEPTAALDAEAEYAVFERFRELTRGRTSFLISPRFPTVRMADRIIVLNAGRIVGVDSWCGRNVLRCMPSDIGRGGSHGTSLPEGLSA